MVYPGDVLAALVALFAKNDRKVALVMALQVLLGQEIAFLVKVLWANDAWVVGWFFREFGARDRRQGHFDVFSVSDITLHHRVNGLEQL